jgi:hypothetical protein
MSGNMIPAMATKLSGAASLLSFCLLLSVGSSEVPALTNATADSGDRFPFVVEIRLRSQLICSGTVVYPRIVVTAAHCLQEKIRWRGVEFYTDAYVEPSRLSVSVVRGGGTETYAVAETAVSPSWRALIRENSIRRFPYDLALIVTEEPIAVDAPPSALRAWPQRRTLHDSADNVAQDGVLVGFGGGHCVSASRCEDAGVRRFMPVAIKDQAYCFRRPDERDQLGSLSVWCLDSGVMPGDSGGALFVETGGGQLYYVGVISAQQGLPPELSGVASWRRSLAAGLAANVPFIIEKARELGYEP